MALLAAAIVAVGFARTFYLRQWLDTGTLPVRLYVHGAIMTAWYALLVNQALLVARRRMDLHRRFGVAAACVAAAIIVSGLWVAAGFVTRSREDPQQLEFAAVVAGFDICSLFAFAALVGAALVLRRRPDFHKRLMILASMSLLGPPLARIVPDMSAFWLTQLLIFLPVVIDTALTRRLHPAFGWGAVLTTGVHQIALRVAASSWWIALASAWAAS